MKFFNNKLGISAIFWIFCLCPTLAVAYFPAKLIIESDGESKCFGKLSVVGLGIAITNKHVITCGGKTNGPRKYFAHIEESVYEVVATPDEQSMDLSFIFLPCDVKPHYWEENRVYMVDGPMRVHSSSPGVYQGFPIDVLRLHRAVKIGDSGSIYRLPDKSSGDSVIGVLFGRNPDDMREGYGFRLKSLPKNLQCKG